MAEVLEGITAEAFEADVLEFLTQAQDARFKKPYKLLTFKPMVELVHYLQANGFQFYYHLRRRARFYPYSLREIYGVPRSMTIGSSVTFTYAEDTQGVVQVMRTKEIEQPIADGPGKTLYIHRAIGRRPIMAAGNADGDVHMLKYTYGHKGATLALLVHHDDDAHEYAYDAGSEKALQLAPQQNYRRQHEGQLEDGVWSGHRRVACYL